MKMIWVFLLLVMFAVGLSGCAKYQWYYAFPPGGNQADFNRDIAYCNDYARTWCATNGTVIISGSRQDYGWGQRNVNIAGNRSCGQQEFDNVRNDCMGMKGYTYTLQKVEQENIRRDDSWDKYHMPTQQKNVQPTGAWRKAVSINFREFTPGQIYHIRSVDDNLVEVMEKPGVLIPANEFQLIGE